jgi:hypothetical protein
MIKEGPAILGCFHITYYPELTQYDYEYGLMPFLVTTFAPNQYVYAGYVTMLQIQYRINSLYDNQENPKRKDKHYSTKLPPFFYL